MDTSRLRHVRAPAALVFPAEAEVPETRRHLDLRTFLYGVLRRAFGSRAAVGSDQFVYFRASSPKKCLAPDVFARLDASNEPFDTWKTWERGAPQLAVEIVSPNERPWSDKLADYHEAGFVEVVCFDADAPEGARIRVWDRLEGDLVERVVEGDRTPCTIFGGAWVVAPADEYAIALRLEDDRGELLRSADELLRRAEEQQRRAEEEQRRAEGERRSAEERIAELEAELARREPQK